MNCQQNGIHHHETPWQLLTFSASWFSKYVLRTAPNNPTKLPGPSGSRKKDSSFSICTSKHGLDLRKIDHLQISFLRKAMDLMICMFIFIYHTVNNPGSFPKMNDHSAKTPGKWDLSANSNRNSLCWALSMCIFQNWWS